MDTLSRTSEKPRGTLCQRAALEQVSGQIGSKQRVVLEQSFVVMQLNDLLALKNYNDLYLIDELRSRGYKVEEGVIYLGVEDIVSTVMRFLMEGKINLRQLQRRILQESAVVCKGVQKDMAAVLGVTPRMVAYYRKKGSFTLEGLKIDKETKKGAWQCLKL